MVCSEVKKKKGKKDTDFVLTPERWAHKLAVSLDIENTTEVKPRELKGENLFLGVLGKIAHKRAQLSALLLGRE